jgi:hypothetical protein
MCRIFFGVCCAFLKQFDDCVQISCWMNNLSEVMNTEGLLVLVRSVVFVLTVWYKCVLVCEHWAVRKVTSGLSKSNTWSLIFEYLWNTLIVSSLSYFLQTIDLPIICTENVNMQTVCPGQEIFLALFCVVLTIFSSVIFWRSSHEFS